VVDSVAIEFRQRKLTEVRVGEVPPGNSDASPKATLQGVFTMRLPRSTVLDPDKVRTRPGWATPARPAVGRFPGRGVGPMIDPPYIDPCLLRCLYQCGSDLKCLTACPSTCARRDSGPGSV
jgi:hypothetical protein